jgi:hypothetical protein
VALFPIRPHLRHAVHNLYQRHCRPFRANAGDPEAVRLWTVSSRYRLPQSPAHSSPHRALLTRPAETQFEVLGTPYSLLSVALPASSNLYTRRGTLLGLNGDPSNTTSTLSVLSPLRRLLKRIPFLYQKITSTTPLTCIISTNTPNTTFSVLALDGTADWALTQPEALLAWSGHSIVVKPEEVTGRGLVALAGRGQVYKVDLKPNEEFIIHPRSLLAYSAGGQKPVKTRLAATALRLQIPKIRRLGLRIAEKLQEIKWIMAIKASKAWQMLGKAIWAIKRKIWGDRVFVKFVGPATILLQSRTGSSLRDLLSKEDLGEYAMVESSIFAPPAKVEIVAEPETAKITIEGPTTQEKTGHSGSLKRAIITKDGKVQFEDSDLKEFVR